MNSITKPALALGMKLLPLAGDPSNDADKVRHEAGDGALHDGVVANDHVLIGGLRPVVLLDGCKLPFFVVVAINTDGISMPFGCWCLRLHCRYHLVARGHQNVSPEALFHACAIWTR